MIVADLMTRKLVTVLPETHLADAARMMLAQRLSGLPVLDNAGRMVGIVTEGDLLRRAEIGTGDSRANWLHAFLLPGGIAADYVKTHGRLVSEVMTADPISVTPETKLTEVAGLMRKKHIKRLPVIEGGRLVGIISRSDLLRALSLKLIQTAKNKLSDEAIRQEIEESFARESWAPKTGIRVTVKDTVVDLEGVIMSDAERQAVKVIAENAPGVTAVTDNLVFVDPGSGMSFPNAGF